MFFRPVGTTEESPQNAEFARPYGTQTTIIAHVPSSELLGNYQVSLRDGARQIHLCRTTRGNALGTEYSHWRAPWKGKTRLVRPAAAHDTARV